MSAYKPVIEEADTAAWFGASFEEDRDVFTAAGVGGGSGATDESTGCSHAERQDIDLY